MSLASCLQLGFGFVLLAVAMLSCSLPLPSFSLQGQSVLFPAPLDYPPVLKDELCVDLRRPISAITLQPW